MPVRLVLLDADQVALAVVHATLRAHAVGKAPHLGSGATQDHGLQAGLVIAVVVHRRHPQVVVLVMQPGDSFHQVALVVVEHVAEAGDAVQRAVVVLARALQFAAHQVTHRLGSMGMTLRGDALVERLRQLLVQRNGDAFDGGILANRGGAQTLHSRCCGWSILPRCPGESASHCPASPLPDNRRPVALAAMPRRIRQHELRERTTFIAQRLIMHP